MRYRVSWVDDEGRPQEREFHYSTTATAFASELHSASGAEIVRTDQVAEHSDEMEQCTVCGHGLDEHKQADRCRHEDCRCAQYDDGHSVYLRGPTGEEPPEPVPVFSEEPFDAYGMEDERFQAGLDGTSRCGNWPASIGEMPFTEPDKMKA